MSHTATPIETPVTLDEISAAAGVYTVTFRFRPGGDPKAGWEMLVTNDPAFAGTRSDMEIDDDSWMLYVVLGNELRARQPDLAPVLFSFRDELIHLFDAMDKHTASGALKKGIDFAYKPVSWTDRYGVEHISTLGNTDLVRIGE